MPKVCSARTARAPWRERPPGVSGMWVRARAKTNRIPTMGLSCWTLRSKLHVSPEESFFGFGWVSGLAIGGEGPARSPPLPPPL